MDTSLKTKKYKVTLRSVAEVDVEVLADSNEEARAKAFEWSGSGDSVRQLNGYWNGEKYVDQKFVIRSDVIDIDNQIVEVAESEGEGV